MKLETKIRSKIEEFKPVSYELTNESHLHAGHIEGHHEESHFRLNMVSEKFTGLSRVERQRLIYGLLDHELKNGLHSIVMKLKSPEEL
jgi:BolA protein